MSPKRAFDVLIELLHSISQELHIRTSIFDLQLVSLRVMTSHRDLGRVF